MRSTRAAVALAVAGAALPAAAQGWRLSAAPAVEHLRLEERDADGRRLVREEGALAALAVAARSPADGDDPGWRIGAELSVGRLAYDGQTQGGAAAQSRTRAGRIAVEAMRLWPLGAGWTAEAGAAAEWFRRRIEPAGLSGGLDERLAQPRWQAGLGWTGGAWSARARLGHGERAPLVVRFDDGAFDRTTLRSGRSDTWRLEADVDLAPGWRLQVGAERFAVGRSLARTLRSDGVAVGRVAQPAWSRERIWIAAAWSPGP